jgi:glycosyltransferase involved in cell wall biosynthesis
MHVAILGTYPPTQCGIATFTADVEASLRLHEAEVTVVPIVAEPQLDPDAVTRDDPESYARAARHLSASGCDVVLIQHEFGIFGGEAGEHVLRFVENLAIPYVVTLHTVLPRFNEHQLGVIRALCRNAATVTVFTGSARRLILDQGIVPARFLQVVAHGAPSELYQEIDIPAARERLGLASTGPVMSTFGLLSQGKGIELAIQAMALLTSEHPDMRYVVAGRTHPEVVRREGERYRDCLRALADDLGVGERVVFLDRFLALDELADLLGVSDVVCTPYRGGDQTVSGVLTFALAAGCPIVSTPYRYARDVLADGAGLLVDFDDEEGFADALHTLLDQQAGARARAAARAASESMEWSKIGEALWAVLAAAVRRPMVELPAPAPVAAAAPATSMRPGTSHLRLLCDDTAVLQHAHHNVPRTEDGYCVDDAGRVLPILDRLAVETGEACWYVAVGRVMAFLRTAAARGDGPMRNFMAWDRQWMDEPYVGDHVGRAIWGLGELMAANGPFTEQACELMDTLAPAVSPDWPTRTLAYAGLGLVAAVSADPSRADDLGRIHLALREWKAPHDSAWGWFEDQLTYDNARLPEVLIRAGHRLDDAELVRNGAAMLQWLESVCRQGRHYRFPGCRGLTDAKGLSWSGDEQPLEAAAMADAHAAWYQVSGDPASLAAIERAWCWFLGENRLGEPLVDIESGAGFDGLGTRTVNRNRGAESTIAVHRCAMAYAAATAASSPNRVARISVHA